MALVLFLKRAGHLKTSTKSVDQRYMHGLIEEELILSALLVWSLA